MKRNDTFSSVEEDRGYKVFKEYSVNTRRKKVEAKPKYVVPWELTPEEFKKSFY